MANHQSAFCWEILFAQVLSNRLKYSLNLLSKHTFPIVFQNFGRCTNQPINNLLPKFINEQQRHFLSICIDSRRSPLTYATHPFLGLHPQLQKKKVLCWEQFSGDMFLGISWSIASGRVVDKCWNERCC